MRFLRESLAGELPTMAIASFRVSTGAVAPDEPLMAGGPSTLNHENAGLDAGLRLRQVSRRRGKGSIRVMARKKFLPVMNRTRRKVVVP